MDASTPMLLNANINRSPTECLIFQLFCFQTPKRLYLQAIISLKQAIKPKHSLATFLLHLQSEPQAPRSPLLGIKVSQHCLPHRLQSFHLPLKEIPPAPSVQFIKQVEIKQSITHFLFHLHLFHTHAHLQVDVFLAFLQRACHPCWDMIQTKTSFRFVVCLAFTVILIPMMKPLSAEFHQFQLHILIKTSKLVFLQKI